VDSNVATELVHTSTLRSVQIQQAAVAREHDVVSLYVKSAERASTRRPLAHAARSNRRAAGAEDRQRDRQQFLRVAMTSPQHHARDAGSRGFDDREIADASFVLTVVVVV